ncbi:plasmid replication initiator TrfA [Ralstonia pseudosolanacearum]|uniref:plasmid replication initiator TrfA n=1 Tax=Ralstonia pseudosolanacearum TaxID=1310165 RepID=UPI00267631E5|nr:plasmid replication initiator TrfA [Ralstonia pseudosolanacearum]MDO3514293.1 plasmid replication initiator TrfA [Ralstonia pseudosolanacearum]MDO3632070.1 plasmid replication initiator TrfA [Ralstonia pseudosolanacearum]
MTALLAETRAAWPKLPLPHGLGKNLVTAHALARSAIFSTQVYRGPVERPEYREMTALATSKSSEIQVFQTAGHRLDQGDADVFYELLRRVFAPGEKMDREAHICFNRNELLKVLGRTRGGRTDRLLDESLDRLFRADFYFSVPDVFVGKSRLILKMLQHSSDRAMDFDYDVLIDVELARLFVTNQWTLLKQSERAKLAGNPLARGLHTYYASLPNSAFGTKTSTLKSMMGRESMHEGKWRRSLEDALKAVKEATGWDTCELRTAPGGERKVFVIKNNELAAKLKKPKARPAVPSPAQDIDDGDDI